MTDRPLRPALYARVSTDQQTTDNQLLELRGYATARGWVCEEYIDRGVSGAKDSRPGLDRLVADARRRKFDLVVCWRLDRLGRNLCHLVVLLEELRVVGVAFVSLNEGIDATTPAGKLQLHVLAALAEFERERIRERVHAGLARARAQGTRLGRPWKVPAAIVVPGGSVRTAAGMWGVSKSTAARWIAAGRTIRVDERSRSSTWSGELGSASRTRMCLCADPPGGLCGCEQPPSCP
jgi:DNA invertase Pin-like site-specific DNA recombinase